MAKKTENKKVTLTFGQAFGVLEGLEVVYTQKLRGKEAVRYYKLGRPLKTLVEDYRELTSKISGEEGSEEWEKNMVEINSSPFAEFDTITFADLENLGELSASAVLKLEPIIVDANPEPATPD